MSESDQSSLTGANLLESLEVLYRGFSCSEEVFDELFLTHIVAEYARSITSLFVNKYEEQLGKCSRGLIDFLNQACTHNNLSDIAWEPALGGAYRAIQGTDNLEVDSIAVALALHLGVQGVKGQWEASLKRPLRLRWDQWLLPLADQIIVNCNHHQVHISTRLVHSQLAFTFKHIQQRWQVEDVECLPQFGLDGCHITLLPRHALTLDDFDDLVATAVETIEPQTVAALQNTVELLRHHAPAYLPWVQRTVRNVFLIQPRVKTIVSGSLDHYFGLIHITCYPELAAMAELLVHEASHQYFNLLCLLGPFDDGTDTTQYYSPAVRKSRPLSRIGIAYHAFANILIFYRLCLDSGIIDNGYCARMIRRMTDEVRQLQEPLHNNPALTTIGRALCQPLIDRVQC
jgi:hypothetical protein